MTLTAPPAHPESGYTKLSLSLYHDGMRRFLCLFAVLIWAFLASGPAHAQAFGPPAPQPILRFAEKNTQLRTLLDLQYQTQLLKRLIEREKIVNNMIQAATSIGIAHPVTPRPDRTLCAHVPANIPCAMAFDDLYPGFNVKPLPQLAPIPAPSTMVMTDTPTASETVQKAPMGGIPLYWLDITCLETKCSAVISPNPSDPAARYRVTVGEKLPDGASVSAISAAGVVLTRDKKDIRLEPAPAAG